LSGLIPTTNLFFERMIDFIQQSGIVTAMVGLLQAPVGTQLYQRMLREGRIRNAYSGDNVDGETNIIPKMELSQLKEGYRKILDSIYSAEGFYHRVRTFISDYQPHRHTVTLQWQEISAFLSSIFTIGIMSPERREYWKLFFWTIFHHTVKNFHWRSPSASTVITSARSMSCMSPDLPS